MRLLVRLVLSLRTVGLYPLNGKSSLCPLGREGMPLPGASITTILIFVRLFGELVRTGYLGS